MAITADGWPYVVPTDRPLEYPAVSQQLADLLEARWDTYQTSGLLTLAVPWSDPSAGLSRIVTRSGGLVTMELVLVPTTDVTLNTAWTLIATLPIGFRPIAPRQAGGCVIHSGSAWLGGIGFADIAATGGVGLRTPAAQTITANNGKVHVLATFRGA